MKILVTGGAGYIGSHCVKKLIENPKHIPVVVDNLAQGHRKAIDEEVIFYKADIGDYLLMKEILEKEKIEAVIHFASLINVGESVKEPFDYYSNNFSKTLNLLKAMNDSNVKKIVFSSTCAVYGTPEVLPLKEEALRNPISPYGRGKFFVENLLEDLAVAKNFRYVIMRYFNASGASLDGSIGEDHKPETHLIPIVIECALGKRDKVKIFGTDYPTSDGTCLRDYIHVEDLADAHILALDKLNEEDCKKYYNLGSGTPYSVQEVINMVEKEAGITIAIEKTERRAGDPPILYADNAKARNELGWNPKHSDLTSIIQSAYKWHKANPRGFASHS